MQEVAKYNHHPPTFNTYFLKYENNPHAKRALRMMIQIQTLNAILTSKYCLHQPDHDIVSLSKPAMIQAAKKTVMYTNEISETMPPPKIQTKPKIEIIEGDCLDVAVHLKRRYASLNPLCLVSFFLFSLLIFLYLRLWLPLQGQEGKSHPLILYL